MSDLSVLIPARNEQFLARTVQDVLENARGDTDVIVVLDGAWADPPLVQDPRVSVIFHAESIGQRAATNEAARVATSRFIMKLDAHCAMAEGFDVVLMESHQPTWTQVPRLHNLHAFDWVCNRCGERRYQGVKPEPHDCGGYWEQEIIWKPKKHATDYTWFDTDLTYRYFDNPALKPYGGDKKKYAHQFREWAQGEITDVMTCLGACWFMERTRFWELGGLDEGHGSWGQMGVELACKSWLSGGALKVNKKTWYAHMFRTGSGFGFPYEIHGSDQDKARAYSRDLWLNDKWDGQVKSLRWLIEKFSPLPGWDEYLDENWVAFPPSLKRSPSKGILYYTDNRLDERIQQAVWGRLERVGLPITSVSLRPIPFGENIVLEKERGYLTMFEQILAGLEAMDAEVVFFCEHDVLYHPSHFDFVPERADLYYYNEHVWKVDAETGRALFYYCQQTSGLVACRELLLGHYRERVRRVRAEGFSRNMGFEPGTHGRKERVDDFKAESYFSEGPNVDIRHGKNLTPSRWQKDQFRNQRYTQGWTEGDSVPGWGTDGGPSVTLGRFNEFIDEVMR